MTQACADRLQEETPELDDAAAFEQACADPFVLQDAWSDLCDAFTEMLGVLNPSTEQWAVTMSGAGWRKQEGRRKVDAATGERLLQEILPDTECSFKIWRRADHILIDNAHHDRPIGGELYRVYPAAHCGRCGEVFPLSYLKVLSSAEVTCADCEEKEKELNGQT